MRGILICAVLLLAPDLALAQSQHKYAASSATYWAAPSAHPLRGVASVYASKFVGRRTANGEILDRQQLTAAHRTLPFGTLLEIINRRNGHRAVVRINDRGPFAPRFVIDLSPAAAAQLGIRSNGIALIEYHIAGN